MPNKINSCRLPTMRLYGYIRYIGKQTMCILNTFKRAGALHAYWACMCQRPDEIVDASLSFLGDNRWVAHILLGPLLLVRRHSKYDE